ncbi:ornithine carbamoyltransferase [Candidatus Haliotispira prima]|uniref:Ornithine carbamoyltransferase n=1 Tax=Candidatus Haliotispira prima TaxID=3034016 RepID=A0ABY8MJZ3_9SPIO|nr:ornithine carbamoyltransferase [Candidatus Haliotispira prima]
MSQSANNLRHFIDLRDFTLAEIEDILRLATEFKANPWQNHLKRKHVALIFEKDSTRTRMSFEVGVNQLGGDSLVIDGSTSHIGGKENLYDSAKVMSRFIDMIMIRANSHDSVVGLAQHSEVPVLNGLTDYNHPCQVLTDIFTYIEHRGPIQGKKIAWIGDANNMANTFVHAAFLFGFHLAIATPLEYQLVGTVQRWAAKQKEAGKPGSIVQYLDPESGLAEAVRDADLVLTDTWISMGDTDYELRKAVFSPYYTVDAALMKQAKPDALFMHCLPASRGQEVTDEVMDGPQSVIFDEAENRLHVQKAIMTWLLQFGLAARNTDNGG